MRAAGSGSDVGDPEGDVVGGEKGEATRIIVGIHGVLHPDVDTGSTEETCCGEAEGCGLDCGFEQFKGLASAERTASERAQ